MYKHYRLYIMAIMTAVFYGLLSACLPVIVPLPSPTQTQTPTKTVTIPHTVTPHTDCTVVTGIPDGDLNLRTGAGTQYAVITTLTEGTTVQVLETVDGWHRVHVINDINGWINGRYCQ